jgi:nucleoside 2-deoxyribosyltransferase
MKAYLANGLFSEADRMYNTYLATLIRAEFPNIELYVPQEAMEINDKNSYADSLMIEDYDTNKLLESDIMIAVLDGEDNGVATEIGVFSGTGKPIIALWTDVRQFGRSNPKKIQALIEDATENQFKYLNLYTTGRTKRFGVIVSSTTLLLQKIKELG